MYKGGIYGGVG